MSARTAVGTLAVVAVGGTIAAAAPPLVWPDGERERVATDEPAPVARAAGAGGGPRCDAIVTPGGRSIEATLGRLAPGDTACLRGGTYREDVRVSSSGVTLRPYRAERVIVAGRLWIRADAADVTVRGLLLDGRNRGDLPSPTINGSGARFIGNDVTSFHTGICFIIGSDRYGRARDTLLRGNRIHDCGRLPPTNHDHGVYVAYADRTRIVDNVIFDNADRGIQLYPDADDTLIAGNVIDGNGVGVIFSGAGRSASDRNVVRNNVIANSRVRADVESYWPPGAPRGSGNLVVDNCVHGGREGTIDARGGGFVARDNVFAAPRYVNRARGDLRPAPSSPCAALLRR